MLELIRKLLDWLAALRKPTRNETIYEEHRPAQPRQTPAGLVLRDAILPALHTLPAAMDSIQARAILLAIAGQEADFHHRWQVLNTPGVKGPARGLWQFERGGGVAGVLRHASSASHARSIAQQRVGDTAPDAVWQALERDDILAALYARLLLWTDPKALPPVGDIEGAWALYLRCWRPGAWTRGNEAQRAGLRAKWTRYYAQAMTEVSS